MKRFTSSALLLICALTQTTCVTSSLLDTASSDFSTERSCPKGSITMKQVPVLPEELLVMPTPPDEVATDPARLAVWKKTTREQMEHDHLTAVAVSGCGLHSTKLCWEERGNEHNHFFCDAVDLTDPRARLGMFRIDPDKGKGLQARLDAAPATHP